MISGMWGIPATVAAMTTINHLLWRQLPMAIPRFIIHASFQLRMFNSPLATP
jgi:hypothetical protein